MRKALVVAGVLVFLVSALAAPALAQYEGRDRVGGERIGRDTPGAGPEVGGVVGVRDVLRAPALEGQQRQTLPFTGSDLTLFVVVGIGVIAAGMLIVRGVRRQQPGPLA